MKKIIILGHKPVAEHKRTDIIIADDLKSAIEQVLEKEWLHEELSTLWGLDNDDWEKSLIERTDDKEFIMMLLDANEMIVLEKEI